MTDIVFLDTETLGLHIDSPIWELAAIRRTPDGNEAALHMFIQHQPEPWISDPRFPAEFVADYRNRYHPDDAARPLEAARMLEAFLSGRPHIIGAVPDFDTTRIRHQLLAPLGIGDLWHYHLIDVENVVAGYLAGRAALGDFDAAAAIVGPPWSSDDLSAAIDINPADYARHTARHPTRRLNCCTRPLYRARPHHK
ncbi:MAG: hypothetical protein PGN37_20505 [Mycobacterium kyogaense]|uniref:hypothetical protein n=1 Tax=Mycobacterium kyogaense TaxID=2212479 RepID=UPI002FF518F1